MNGGTWNRYDDPERYYRVLYAGTSRYTCFVETLSRFRLNVQLYAELQAIEGDDDYMPLGEVPVSWLEARCFGLATVGGNFADVMHSDWVAQLRVSPTIASACARLSVSDFDGAALRSTAPREITQLVSRVIYNIGRYVGIRYASKFGDDLENWAIFEPFSTLQSGGVRMIQIGDADLQRALNLHKLRMT